MIAAIGEEGACFEAIWSLLKSVQDDDEWNPLLRGSMRSVVANRQYPQVRVKAAGWDTHDRCLLCAVDIMMAGWTLDDRKLFEAEVEKEGKAKMARKSVGEMVGTEVLEKHQSATFSTVDGHAPGSMLEGASMHILKT